MRDESAEHVDTRGPLLHHYRVGPDGLVAWANLVIASRKMKNLEAAAAEIRQACGVEVLSLACDVAKEEDIDGLVKSAVDKFGRIDIMVNNAGATWGAPTLKFPLERWDQMFDINVRGVWILTQKVANAMKARGGANIINISSIMGFRGSDEFQEESVSQRQGV